MKRLIKFYNKYRNDEAQFSDCSTEYEVLPVLVADDIGVEYLTEYALLNNIEMTGKKKKKEKDSWRDKITEAVELKEYETETRWGDEERNQYWLGFIKIDERGPLKPVATVDNKITKDEAYEILNNQSYGVSTTGTHMRDNEHILIIEDWSFFHEMRLLGYSLDSFYESVGVDEYYSFSDSVFCCGGCYEYDDNENGYSYNYRIINCEIFGMSCGCYKEAQKDNISEYVDNAEQPIDLEVAEELAEGDSIEWQERFIGGMTDGRGGYYNGESCRESDPRSALDEYKEKYPDSDFILSFDESGQFQTYFSIWKVL